MAKLPNPGNRSTSEWIGKTPDSDIPAYVRIRVWDRHEGICHIAKRKIMAGEPWDMEHVIAICNGGENRESNLAPALRDKHKGKTAKDRAVKAKTDKKKKSHLGISKSKGWNTRLLKKMDGSVVDRSTGERV